MKKLNRTPLALALGTTLLAGIASTAAHAEFGVTELSQGYMQLAAADAPDMKKKEGGCGEAKCGADKKAAMEGDMKAAEGKCGGKKMEGDMKPAAEGEMMKAPEGKCGGKKMDGAMEMPAK